MPRMNQFDAELIKVDGKYAVKLGELTVVLSEEKQQRLLAKNVEPQKVVLGVRPEHLMLDAKAEAKICGIVDVSEMMGSEIHYHVTAQGEDIIIIVPTIGGDSFIPMGKEITFTFQGSVAHIFDKETGKNLEF